MGGRVGRREGGRGNLIYTHCRLYSCVALINYDYVLELYCKFTYIFIVQWVVKKKKKIQIKKKQTQAPHPLNSQNLLSVMKLFCQCSLT